MTIDVIQFKTAFPEFAQSADAQVEFWLTNAIDTINPQLFGNQYNLAVMLFTAHYLSGSLANQRASVQGGVPGSNIGIATSKTVGPVSKSISPLGIDARAGQLATTTYGQRLWAMMKASVAGGFYRSGRRLPYGTPPNGYLGFPGYDPGRFP